jgi:aspartate/methionine/tyrosine aminotransferase
LRIDVSRIERSLTSLEAEALSSPDGALNLTDGHPRQPLTTSQRAVVGTIPAMFDEALNRPFADVERSAHKAFYGCTGQFSAPIGLGRILSTYSSTIALDIVARVLAERIDRVAVLHPTFDNIADLFRARGLRLQPISQEQVDTGSWHPPSEVGAVVVVAPNNPTGWILQQKTLRRLATSCATAGQVLVMDASFRGQDSRAHYDTYRTMEETGVEWIVVEDTGKLWSVSELKAGFLAWSANSTLRFVTAFDEVMLSVSPLILMLISKLSADAVAGGFEEMFAGLKANRQMAADLLGSTPMELTDPTSRISVARITLPLDGPNAHDAYRNLVEQGIHMLPCSKFHWARPAEGDRQLRLSLSRPPATVERAARALAAIYQSSRRQVGVPS